MSQQLQRASQDKLEPFRSALAQAEAEFRKALPSTVAKFLTPERISKLVLTSLSKTPILLQCSQASILRSVMDAVSLGLEPGGALGHAYLVPFQNSKKDSSGNWHKQWEAQLIIGYRGLIELARRSGHIQSVEAHVVYKQDGFKIVFGRNPELAHTPTFDKERGDIVAAYCVAEFKDGSKHCEFMTRQELDAIKARSKAAQFSDKGPWHTDYAEMARKTVVRRAAKYWPLSIEFARALEVDEPEIEDVAEIRRALPAPVIMGAAEPQPDGGEEHEASSDDDEAGADTPPFDEAPAEPPSATKRVLSKVKNNGTAREPGSDG